MPPAASRARDQDLDVVRAAKRELEARELRTRSAAAEDAREKAPAKPAVATREVMTADEVGVYLGVARSTVYKMVQAGEIPYAKIGSMLRFPKAMVDRWLADHTVQPERTLLDEFELLYEKFHLKKFLRAKGIAYQTLTDEQLVEHLRVAVRDLRSYEQAAQGRLPELGEEEEP
jgi:excisionase family DNA binding protein